MCNKSVLIGTLLLSLMILSGIGIRANATEDITVAYKTVVISGMGLNSDQTVARDDALADAQRRAVDLVMALYIDENTLLENQQLVTDVIYSNIPGYLQTCTILSESCDSSGNYRVTIRADVRINALLESIHTIAAHFTVADAPRVIVYLSDASHNIVVNPVQEFIASKLHGIGFSVVNDRQLIDSRLSNMLHACLDGTADTNDVQALRECADILIVGRVKYTPKRSATGHEGYTADGIVSVKAIRTDTGQLITSMQCASNDEQSVATMNDAIENSLINACAGWLQCNQAKVIEAVADPTQRSMILVKECGLPDVLHLCETLQAMPTIRQVSLRQFANGVALLEVDAVGAAQDLAETLFVDGSAKLEILGTTGNTLQMRPVRTSH